MGRKHHRNRIPPADHAEPPQPASIYRRKALYGLLVASAAAISFGIYSSRGPLAESADSRSVAGASEPATVGELASVAPFHDFGSISMAGGNVMHRFIIANTGRSAVTVTRLTTSCMCTSATLSTASGRRGPFGMPGHGPMPTIRERLEPGEMAQVEVVFDPAAHGPAGVGRTSRTVTIRPDVGPELQLRFVAMVRP